MPWRGVFFISTYCWFDDYISTTCSYFGKSLSKLPWLSSCVTHLVTFVMFNAFIHSIVMKWSYNCTPYIPTFIALWPIFDSSIFWILLVIIYDILTSQNNSQKLKLNACLNILNQNKPNIDRSKIKSQGWLPNGKELLSNFLILCCFISYVLVHYDTNKKLKYILFYHFFNHFFHVLFTLILC
jgi:hypothetical protein